MRSLLVLSMVLFPAVAQAQTPKPVEDQANAMAMQATSILSAMAGEIGRDQAAIAERDKQIADLTAKLAAATKTEPPAGTPKTAPPAP